MKIAHLDYEGRSGVDITEVGSHRWSIDPRFEIFMAAVSRDGDPRVYLWINPLFRTPDEMGENEEAERILAEADIVYAHNAQNEMANTWGALEQGKACPFPTMPPETIWRCTAAMARKAGLPYSLEKLCATLRVVDSKDRTGKALIQFFCIPDDETGKFNEPRDHPEKWSQFCAYCRQDVRAETECGVKLKAFELTGAALETFQFDLRMNQRGIPINLTAARNAQKIIDEVQGGVREEFQRLTGYNVTQRAKVLAWFNDTLKLNLPNTQAATIEEKLVELSREINDPTECIHVQERATEAHRVLAMYQAVSYAAVKKIQTMLDCVCPDGLIRGTFMYYGAGTGRWSAQKLQPHNFKKCPPELRDIADAIYAAVSGGISATLLDQIYCSPLEALASCIRNFIHHPEHELLDGDFAAVEARIICWLAGQQDVLEKWRRGEDLYKWMASHIYNVPQDQVTPDQREVGKRVILGAGFQMGWKKFKSSCLTQYQLDLPDELCQKGIKLFRKLCPDIRDYWWTLNRAASEAIKTSGTSGAFSVRRVAGIPYLLFKLRSGRSLAYPYPEVNMVKWIPDPDDLEEGEIPEVKWREEITYWGQLPMSQVWGRVKLYGGKLAENETQATAADFMAHGALNAERLGMPPFMLVHDQGLALRDKGQTKDQFAAALADLPSWANGFPMKVEAKIHPYFKK